MGHSKRSRRSKGKIMFWKNKTENPATYVCPKCKDTGFIVRIPGRSMHLCDCGMAPPCPPLSPPPPRKKPIEIVIRIENTGGINE